MKVEIKSEESIIGKGEAIDTQKDEWFRYSTSFPEVSEYIAVCLPIFAPSAAHRDD